MTKHRPASVRSRTARSSSITLALVVGIAAGAAGAADRTWIGATPRGGGDGVSFADAGNWMPLGVPGALDRAVFGPLGGVVGFPGGVVSNDRLLVAMDGLLLSLDLAGGQYLLGSAGADGAARGIVIGAGGGHSTVEIGGGELAAQHGVIGADGSADVSVAADATLRLDAVLTVGEQSPATLAVGGSLFADKLVLLQPGAVHAVENGRIETRVLALAGGVLTVGPDATLVVARDGSGAEGSGLIVGIEEEPSGIRLVDGALLEAPSAVLGPFPNTRSIVEVENGARLETAGDLDVGWEPVPAGSLGWARLAVRSGGLVEAGETLALRQGGSLLIDGGWVVAGKFENDGYGAVEVTLPETLADPLIVADEALIGGALFLRQRSAGAVPGLGSQYPLVEAASSQGAPAAIIARPVPGLRFYQTTAVNDGGGIVLEIGLLEQALGLSQLIPVELPSPPNAIAADLFDGDSLADLFVTIPGDGPRAGLGAVLLGEASSDIGFALVETVPIGPAPSGLAIGDFNGDGQPDFAISDEDEGVIRVIFGAFDGALAGGSVLVPGPTLTVGGRPRGVRSADVTGDGKADLIWADPDQGVVVVVDGDGKGGFGGETKLASGPQPSGVDPLDLDNDKDIDIIAINAGAGAALDDGVQPPSLVVIQNLGEGTFAAPVFYEIEAGPVGLAQGDLNGDGPIDVVTINAIAKTMSILLGVGDGTFLPAVSVPLSGTPTAIGIGDLDNDEGKDLDIAVLLEIDGLPSLTVFRNDSSGGQLVLTILENAQELIGLPEALTTFDTDDDGPADLIFVGSFGDAGGKGFVSVVQGVPIFCFEDLDGDGIVGGGDLGVMLARFGSSDPAADLNDDGVVDGADLTLLFAAWGPCASSQ